MAENQGSQADSKEGRSAGSLSPSVEDLYLESYAFTTAAAIVGSVDRKVFVMLRDGRNLFGILRTFDQFANVVLQDTIERIYLGSKATESDGAPHRFGEIYRGIFMIRGENVVMIGESDIDTEDDHLQTLEQVPFEEAEAELKRIHGQRLKEENVKTQKLLSKGYVNDFIKHDLY